MIEAIRQGLKADGFEVSISKLCRWFGVAAAHVLLQADQGSAEGESSICRANQGHDRGGAVVRLSDGGQPARLQQEHGAADLPAQGLAGPQAGRSVTGRGSRRCRRSRQPRMNAGPPTCAGSGVAAMAGSRWRWSSTAIPANCWAGICRAPARPSTAGRPGACPDHPLRHAGPGSRAVPAEVRQRPGLHQSQLHAPGPQLRPEARVHHAALPAAERHGRARHPDAEGAMRPSPSLREPAARHPRNRRLDQLLQPPPPASGAGHENPRSRPSH